MLAGVGELLLPARAFAGSVLRSLSAVSGASATQYALLESRNFTSLLF